MLICLCLKVNQHRGLLDELIGMPKVTLIIEDVGKKTRGKFFILGSCECWRLLGWCKCTWQVLDGG